MRREFAQYRKVCILQVSLWWDDSCKKLQESKLSAFFYIVLRSFREIQMLQFFVREDMLPKAQKNELQNRHRLPSTRETPVLSGVSPE